MDGGMKMIKRGTSALAALAFLMGGFSLLPAAQPVPAGMSYRGVLRDAADRPLVGLYDMVFRFYDAAVGGEELLVDAHEAGGTGAVAVPRGTFSVALGTGVVTDGAGGGPGDPYRSLQQVFQDFEDVWLEVQVEGETRGPRRKVTSADSIIDGGQLSGPAPEGSESLSTSNQVQQTSIVWVNRGHSSNNFGAVFGPDEELAKAVVDHALLAWQEVFSTFDQNGSDVIEVWINMSEVQGHCGGFTSPDFAIVPLLDPFWFHGTPDWGTITLGNCGDEGGWFLDPTPWEHSEFLGRIDNPFVGWAWTGTDPATGQPGDSPALDKHDLYSLVLHEMAHVLGILPAQAIWTPAIANTPYLWERHCCIPSPWLIPGPLDDELRDVYQGDSASIGRLYSYDGILVKALYTTNNGGTTAPYPLHIAPPHQDHCISTDLLGARDVHNAGLSSNRRYLPSVLTSYVIQDVYGHDALAKGLFPNLHAQVARPDPSLPGGLLVRGGGAGEGPICGTDTGNSPDQIEVGLDSNGDLEVDVNLGVDVPGTSTQNVIFSRSFAIGSIDSVRILGNDGIGPGPDGDDVITLDFTGGNWLPAGGLFVDGGSGNNTLVIKGPPGAVHYVVNNDHVTISGAFGAIGFTHVSELVLMAHAPSSNTIMDVVDTGFLQKLVLVGSDGTDTITVLDTDNNLLILEVASLDGPDQIIVEAMGFQTALTIDAGGGDDVAEFTPAGDMVQLPVGIAVAVNVDGGDGADLVLLQDFAHGDATVHEFAVDFGPDPAGQGGFVRDGIRFLFHVAVEDVHLNAGLGSDDVSVFGTPMGSDLTISSNSGNDDFFVGSGTPSLTVDEIFSHVKIIGGAGTNLAFVDDRGDATGDQVTVTDQLVGAAPGDSFFGVSGPFKGSLEYHDLTGPTFFAPHLTIHLSGGSDVANVESTAAGTDTTIFGDRGGDQFTVTAPQDPSQQGSGGGSDRRNRNGTVDQIRSLLWLDGQPGSDTLTVIDTTDVSADAMTLDEDEIGRGAGDTFLGSTSAGIVYKDMAQLTVKMGSGGNTASIRATHPATKTSVKAGQGDDALLVANIAGKVNDIRSKLDIDGQGGQDVATVDDATETSASTVTVTHDQILGNGTYFGAGGELTHDGWEDLIVKAGLAGDNVSVTGTKPGTDTALLTGGGVDVVAIGPAGKVDLIRSSLSIDGGGAFAAVGVLNFADSIADDVTITSSQVLGSGTFFGPGGSLDYLNVSQLNLVTSNATNAADRINLQSTNPATAYLVGGGPGSDQFLIDSNGLLTSGGTVDGIVSDVTLVGGTGPLNVITLVDEDDTSGDNATLASTGPLAGRIGQGAFDTFFGPGGKITYSDMQLVSLHTSAAADQISLTPAPATPAGTRFSVNGHAPTLNDPQPGDRLDLDLSGVTSPKVTVKGPGQGVLDSTSHALISWQSIELITEASGGARFHLLLDMNDPGLSGNDGAEDRVESFSGHAGAQKTLDLQLNGKRVLVAAESAVDSLTVFGSADADTFVVLKTPEGWPTLPGLSPLGHTNPAFIQSGLTPTNVSIHFDGGSSAAIDRVVVDSGVVFPDPLPQSNPSSGVINVLSYFTMSFESTS